MRESYIIFMTQNVMLIQVGLQFMFMVEVIIFFQCSVLLCVFVMCPYLNIIEIRKSENQIIPASFKCTVQRNECSNALSKCTAMQHTNGDISYSFLCNVWCSTSLQNVYVCVGEKGNARWEYCKFISELSILWSVKMS